MNVLSIWHNALIVQVYPDHNVCKHREMTYYSYYVG